MAVVVGYAGLARVPWLERMKKRGLSPILNRGQTTFFWDITENLERRCK
jgi:hypothetical protein